MGRVSLPAGELVQVWYILWQANVESHAAGVVGMFDAHAVSQPGS
jgi:hypothetical protein